MADRSDISMELLRKKNDYIKRRRFQYEYVTIMDNDKKVIMSKEKYNVENIRKIIKNNPSLINKYPELKPEIVLHMMNMMLRVIKRTNADTDINKHAQKMLWTHLLDILANNKIGGKNKMRMLKTILFPQKKYEPRYRKPNESEFYD